MGAEKPLYQALKTVIGFVRLDVAAPLVAARGKTPNQRLLAAAYEYSNSLRGGRRSSQQPARRRVLALGNSQADPRPGQREGIGVVDGGWEGPGIPAPHGTLHLTPTATIALEAHRFDDVEVRDLWLRVLGRWLAFFRDFQLPDRGTITIAAPGSRFWPFKSSPPPVGDDGFHWLRPGQSLCDPTDACARLLLGKDQRDNRNRKHGPGWLLDQAGRAGFAAPIALYKLLDAGLAIPKGLAPKLFVPIVRSSDGLRSIIAASREEIGKHLTGFAPAVEIRYHGDVAQIGYAPNTIPPGWEI